MTVGGTTASPTFSSSNNSVATVSSSGVVTAVAPGNATVTVSVGGTSRQVAVEVTAQPVSVVFQGFTKDGQAIDPTDLSGVVTAEIDIDVPAGFGGTLSVLFDDIEVASVDVPAASPPARSAEPAPARTSRRESIDIATNPVSIIDDDLVPTLPNGRDFMGVAHLIPNVAGSQTVSVGLGTVRTNNDPVVAIRGIASSGPTITLADGRVVRSGTVSFDAHYVSYDATPLQIEAIEMIEVLKDGASALYGSDAIAGVVNFVLPDNAPFPDGLQDEDGSLTFGETARVRYVDGMVGDRVVLNFDRRAGANLPWGFNADNRGPEPDGANVPSLWVGPATDLALKASLNFLPFDRFSGLDFCQYNVGPDPDNWEFQNIQFGSELRETPSLDFNWGATCWDLLGNFREYNFLDSGLPSRIGVTWAIPGLEVGNGSIPRLGPVLAGDFIVNPIDTPNAFGGTSGISFDDWLLSQRVITAAGSSCLVGNPNDDGGCDPITPSFSWSPGVPFPILTESAYVDTAIQVGNNAWTLSPPLLFYNTHDVMAPSLTGDLQWDGILGDEVGVGENFRGLTWADDLDIVAFGLWGNYSGSVDFSLGYSGRFLGRASGPGAPLQPTFTYDETSVPFPRTLQFTELQGIGWVPQTEVLLPSTISATALDPGFQMAGEEFDVPPGSFSPFTGPLFIDLGFDDWRLFSNTTVLCNSKKGFDCGGTPEQGQFNVSGFTSGTFNVDRIALYKMPVHPGFDQAYWPFATTEDFQITDFGGFSALEATFNVNAMADELIFSDYSIRAVLFSPENDGLITNDVQLSVIGEFQVLFD